MRWRLTLRMRSLLRARKSSAQSRRPQHWPTTSARARPLLEMLPLLPPKRQSTTRSCKLEVTPPVGVTGLQQARQVVPASLLPSHRHHPARRLQCRAPSRPRQYLGTTQALHYKPPSAKSAPVTSQTASHAATQQYILSSTSATLSSTKLTRTNSSATSARREDQVNRW